MPEFIKAHLTSIIVVLVIIAALVIGLSQYLDAATSLLPGGEDGGLIPADGVGK